MTPEEREAEKEEIRKKFLDGVAALEDYKNRLANEKAAKQLGWDKK